MKELVERFSLRKLMKEESVIHYRRPEGEEERIVGSSPRMQEIYKIIGQVAPR